ncbi:putative RNA-directed DNA polymerase, eukaryota, reverse transcriptase zinc-binding domain protein, partial [Tanacetum coccineum]
YLGASSTPSYSPGPSTPPSYSPRPSTPQSYFPGPSRNAECSNCKHLLRKIKIENWLDFQVIQSIKLLIPLEIKSNERSRVSPDRVLIANEIVNVALKSKLKLLLFKVNFEKAFDSVSLDFLIDVMKKRGFGHRWCVSIKGCLQSATILVLVYRSPTKYFRMERGLRQGDPLSLFLFIIVAEDLQVSLLDACDNGIYNGLSLANDGSNLSLLQYTADTLFFCEWSAKNAKNLVRILSWFQDA